QQQDGGFKTEIPPRQDIGGGKSDCERQHDNRDDDKKRHAKYLAEIEIGPSVAKPGGSESRRQRAAEPALGERTDDHVRHDPEHIKNEPDDEEIQGEPPHSSAHRAPAAIACQRPSSPSAT